MHILNIQTVKNCSKLYQVTGFKLMEDSSVQRCAGKQCVDVWKAEFFK